MSFLTKIEASSPISPEVLKQIREEVNALLKPLEEKFSVKMELGRATYSHNNFTFKLEGSRIGDDGSVVTKEAEAFKMLAKMYGLEAEDLGKTFKTQGKEFTITGLSTKSNKFPIQAKGSDGKSYKFPAESVKLFLGRK